MKILHDLNKHEIPLCLLFNRANRCQIVSRFFAVISRLGDGVFWYVLIVMLPIIYGSEAMTAVVHMVVAGLIISQGSIFFVSS